MILTITVTTFLKRIEGLASVRAVFSGIEYFNINFNINFINLILIPTKVHETYGQVSIRQLTNLSVICQDRKHCCHSLSMPSIKTLLNCEAVRS